MSPRRKRSSLRAGQGEKKEVESQSRGDFGLRADTVVSVCVGVGAERAYCAQDFIGLEPIICNFYTNLIR
jgi:hypothetical protein